MDKRIREAYNDTILAEALKRYAIAQDNLHALDGFESFIYTYERENRNYILRISHSSRRTRYVIRGEIDWVNYLAENTVPVCRAVPSKNDEFVEVVEADDGYFSATSFEKAQGGPPGKDQWNAELFREMGRVMGKMHALTKEYRPAHPSFIKPSWHEETECFAEKYLPPPEKTAIEKFTALSDYLHTLPKGTDSYGLVHIDFHGGNFFVENGGIMLFDFDDCQYSWFVDDIAMALFYAVPHDCVGAENIKTAKHFFQIFMEGYHLENALENHSLKQIPYFLKRREIDLYIMIHRSFDLNHLDAWCQSFMENRKYKIENDIPYIDMDFE
ncbi:phosphotransferase [Candidatus Poribacteria bacterium]|nr:phosphotransferase [Candidatus Poribacteria bacterium]